MTQVDFARLQYLYLLLFLLLQLLMLNCNCASALEEGDDDDSSNYWYKYNLVDEQSPDYFSQPMRADQIKSRFTVVDLLNQLAERPMTSENINRAVQELYSKHGLINAVTKKQDGENNENEMINAQDDTDLMQLANVIAHDATDDDGELAKSVCLPLRSRARKCSAVKREYNLDLDGEAESLCDSHQVCTACSGIYGASRSVCDDAYVSVAADACERESSPEACAVQADALLDAMRNVHVPVDGITARLMGCHDNCIARAFTGGKK